jgi:hypothetical protein
MARIRRKLCHLLCDHQLEQGLHRSRTTLLNYNLRCQTLGILKDIVSRYTSTDLWRTNLFQSQLSHLLWVKRRKYPSESRKRLISQKPVRTKKHNWPSPKMDSYNVIWKFWHTIQCNNFRKIVDTWWWLYMAETCYEKKKGDCKVAMGMEMYEPNHFNSTFHLHLVFQVISLCTCHLIHVCNIPEPSHPHWFDHPDILQGVQWWLLKKDTAPWSWCKSWSSSLWNFFQHLVTLSVLGPNIFLSTLSSSTLVMT